MAKNRDDECAEVGPGESILCCGGVHWGHTNSLLLLTHALIFSVV